MEFSGEMNIYRESELSGDFEGEISKKRIRRALADPKPISPYRQLYLFFQNKYFTHLMLYGILGREKRPSLTPPAPSVRGS
ncbi:hypothetical protein CK203_098206 [Vitis vinifera]|uniref:Uncharacterized protein n=1 Tax=Vitis vinifera TaxID=29760 RepID=A0A438CJI7_VITVI|nr:hypothetical protein CK203_098206 [Vitis vinifera]